jgi:hypothetical protein
LLPPPLLIGLMLRNELRELRSELLLPGLESGLLLDLTRERREAMMAPLRRKPPGETGAGLLARTWSSAGDGAA